MKNIVIKTCSRCKIPKEISLFYNKASACKECERKRRKEIYNPVNAHNSYKRNLTEENKEKRRKYSLDKRNENVEYARQKVRDWRKANPNYKRNRLANDLNYRISENLRGRLYKAVKEQFKAKSISNLIGCNINFYKDYLESKFLEEMSWDNYGQWHIDHIIPIKSFNMQDIKEQKQCFHYTNTQPLWAIDNFKKSAKYE